MAKFTVKTIASICRYSGLSAIGESLWEGLEKLQVKRFDNDTCQLCDWLSEEVLPLAPASKAITSEDEAGQYILNAVRELDRPPVSPWACVDRVLGKLYAQVYAYSMAYQALNTYRTVGDIDTAREYASSVDNYVKSFFDAQMDLIPWPSEGYEWTALEVGEIKPYWLALANQTGEDQTEAKAKWLERLAAIREKNTKTTQAFARKIGAIVDLLRGAGFNATEARAMASWCFGGGKDKVMTEVLPSGEGKLVSTVQELVKAYANRDKSSRKRS